MSQTERIFYLLDTLKNKKSFITDDVAGIFEVSDRTIRRDIEYIRDRLRIEIQYSKGSDAGYFISEKEKEYLVNLQKDESVLFLSLLKSICKNNFLFPVDYNLVGQALRIKDSVSIDNLTDRISYEMSEEKEFDFSLFNIILCSIENKQQLDISYSNLNGSESKRTIEPQYLKNSDGQWYLLAFCHYRNELRIFHLSRISQWKILAHNFISQISLDDIVDVFDSSFGIMTGPNEITNVSILFKNKTVRMVSGKRWHKDQHMEKVKDGIIVSFPVHSFQEILNRVFAYNSDAEVLEPPEFRELWKKKIAEMAEIYL
jgi:predicted DNA-binding transcriptional regulator YafY